MTRSALRVAVMLVALGSLTACGVGGTTLSPTLTAAPSVTTEPAGSGGEPSTALEPVDLLVMAASGGAGVSERYAPVLSAALDREVRTHDKIGALPTSVLSGAEDGADVVAGAEVILFYFPPAGREPPAFLTCLEAPDAVSGDPDYSGPTWAPGQTWDPPPATTVEDWQAWRDVLDREYEAIWTMRDGQPTTIRAYGGWNPWVVAWRQLGIEAECTAGEEAMDQAQRGAAEAAGAVYVSMLDIFTGPQHDQDPAERGWLAEDGMHLSDSGKDVLVEALAAAGFDAGQAPR
jgi:hypothetical protein